MKYIGILLALSSSFLDAKAATQPPSCQEVHENGVFLGCKLKPNDPILRTRYGGPVYNNYGGYQVTGFSMFSIDKDGIYTGWSLVRHGDVDCLKQPHTWTGRLFKLSSNQYAAWGIGSEGVGYYLVTLSKNRMQASSTLMAAYKEVNVIENNQLMRLDARFAVDNLMKISQPYMCK